MNIKLKSSGIICTVAKETDFDYGVMINGNMTFIPKEFCEVLRGMSGPTDTTGIPTISYKGKNYPALVNDGNAMQWALPFAKQFCKGAGYDIGCNRPEWAYPGAMMVEPSLHMYDAMKLPNKEVDYIVSSHVLEHIPERIGTVLEYWLTKIRKEGIIFLYLPNCDYQEYWAFGNTKHIHYLNPAIMKGVCKELHDNGLIEKHFVTEGHDLNYSFYTILSK